MSMQGQVNAFWPQQPVEQQTPGGETQPDRSLWVTNPSPVRAIWDADDIWRASAGGDLAAGESYWLPALIYADWSPHTIALEVQCGKFSTIDMSITVLGTGFEQMRRVNGRWYSTRLRRTLGVRGPDYDHDSSALLPVPDSGAGGRAHPVTVRFRVRNVGTHTARRVRMLMEIVPQFATTVELGLFTHDNIDSDLATANFWWTD